MDGYAPSYGPNTETSSSKKNFSNSLVYSIFKLLFNHIIWNKTPKLSAVLSKQQIKDK